MANSYLQVRTDEADKEQTLSEVHATMKMENMELTTDDIQLLKEYQKADSVKRDAIRQAIVAAYKEE